MKDLIDYFGERVGTANGYAYIGNFDLPIKGVADSKYILVMTNPAKKEKRLLKVFKSQGLEYFYAEPYTGIGCAGTSISGSF